MGSTLRGFLFTNPPQNGKQQEVGKEIMKISNKDGAADGTLLASYGF